MVKIYYLQDPISMKIRYIGKTENSLEKRLIGHVHEAKKYKNLHKKHWFALLAKQGLKPNIILLKEVDDDKWEEEERYYIQKFKNEGHDLINVFEGGNGWTSNCVKKLWQNKEYRDFHTKRVQKELNPFFGKKHTEETKEILRKKCPHYGKNHPNYGKKPKESTTQKNRLNQPNIRKIARFDMNNILIDSWIGIKEMCRKLNLDQAAVIRVAKGKNKHHKKFKFKYL
jgi:group I intron endonuclease